MRKDSDKLINIMLNTNLRILDMNIQISTQIDNSQNDYYFNDTYSEEDPVQIEFKIMLINRAFSMLNKITLEKINLEIGNHKETFITDNDSHEILLLRQKENVYMIIKCRMERQSKMFNYFAAFYMQKGWFVPDAEMCKLELKGIEIQIRDSKPKKIDIDLIIKPGEFTNERERKFYIETYDIRS